MINLFAVILCIIIYWILGALWFSPIVFGEIWSKALGRNIEELGPNGKQVIGTVLTSILSVFILAYLLELIGSYDILTGLILGLLLGIGFVFTVDLYDVLFEDKNIIAFLIDTGYHMVALIIVGTILGFWKL